MIYFFLRASDTECLSISLFQYGDLHEAQFFGNTDFPSSFSLGHHLCLHLVHSSCSTCTFFPKTEFISDCMLYYLAYMLFVVNNIYTRLYNMIMNTTSKTQKLTPFSSAYFSESGLIDKSLLLEVDD